MNAFDIIKSFVEMNNAQRITKRKTQTVYIWVD